MSATSQQANAYLEGEAMGILSLLTVQTGWLENDNVKKSLSESFRNEILARLYKEALISVGKTEEDADYWVQFFLEPKK